MKRNLLVVLLAAVCASVVPTAAPAASGNANAAWWLLGGTVLGYWARGAQQVRPHVLPQNRVGIIHCPAGTVHYEPVTNTCYLRVRVAVAGQPDIGNRPAVRPATPPTQAGLAPAVNVTKADTVDYNGQSCVRRNGKAGREGTLNGQLGCFKF